MALIGKDGKDGNETKPAVFEALINPASRTRVNLPVQRKFVRVVLEPSGSLSQDVLDESDNYWVQASGFGLVGASSTAKSGNTTLVLTVSDVDEARQLAENDPLVSRGDFTVTVEEV